MEDDSATRRGAPGAQEAQAGAFVPARRYWHDRLSGAGLALTLPPQRAAMALIRKSDGVVIAKYGF